MSSIDAMAKNLGQNLGRTDEYQALKQAAAAVNDDRELVELRNKLEKLESELVVQLRSGKEPDETSRKKYESLAIASTISVVLFITITAAVPSPL